jgi:hypothetical protein
MSADDSIDELLTGMVAGEYVQLDLDLFLKAFSTVLRVMADELPCDEDFTFFNRGMHTAERLFPDAAQRRSFRWRAVVVMSIAKDKKYRNYRNDTAGKMNFALAATATMVRGNAWTTKEELRESFDTLFRRVLTTRECAAANPGLLQRH